MEKISEKRFSTLAKYYHERGRTIMSLVQTLDSIVESNSLEEIKQLASNILIETKFRNLWNSPSPCMWGHFYPEYYDLPQKSAPEICLVNNWVEEDIISCSGVFYKIVEIHSNFIEVLQVDKEGSYIGNTNPFWGSISINSFFTFPDGTYKVE